MQSLNLCLSWLSLQMCLSKPPFSTTLIEGDIAVPDSQKRDGIQGSYVVSSGQLWKDGLVLYSFEEIQHLNEEMEPIFRNAEKQLIRDTLAVISSHVPYLHFRYTYGPYQCILHCVTKILVHGIFQLILSV